MMGTIKKNCVELLYTIGGYRFQEWALENQLKKEVRRLIREGQGVYGI